MSAIVNKTGNINTAAPAPAPAGPGNGGNGQFQAAVVAPDSNYEDLTILKVLACVPVLGNIVSFVVGITLLNKISDANFADNVPKKKVELIKISIHHNICSIISNVLTVAAVVTFIALCLIIPVVGLVVGLVLGGAVGFHGYMLHRDTRDLAGWEARSVFFGPADNAGVPAQANPADALPAPAA